VNSHPFEKYKQAKSKASAVSTSVDPQKFVSSSFVSMTSLPSPEKADAAPLPERGRFSNPQFA
jgi:hypothetical protein